MFLWKGDEVIRATRAACRWGIDSVLADCVTTAKSTAPVKTSVYQGSIQMRPAVEEGDKVTGTWGSFAVKYARWINDGTPPHVIVPKNKLALYWKGASHPVRIVFHQGTKPNPHLIEAAETHYPSLALRIRAQMEWGGTG